MSLYKILLSLCSETQKLDLYNKPKNAKKKKRKKKRFTSFHLKDCKTQNSKFILIDSKIEDIDNVSFIL